MLKLKFQRLHETVVNDVNAASIMDFLFGRGVIGNDDMRTQEDSLQRRRSLLASLHNSAHPQAFVQLYLAIKKERHLQWLVDRIDKYTDQSVISLVQQMYISEKKGYDLFLKHQYRINQLIYRYSA